MNNSTCLGCFPYGPSASPVINELECKSSEVLLLGDGYGVVIMSLLLEVEPLEDLSLLVSLRSTSSLGVIG